MGIWQNRPLQQLENKWPRTGLILLPQTLVWPIIKHLHDDTHYGKDALMDLIRPWIRGPKLHQTMQWVIKWYPICVKNNPKSVEKNLPQGTQYIGDHPFDNWQMDFTQVPRTTGSLRYLLIFVDTFSRWTDTLPARMEKATEVTQILLKELIPWYGPQSTLQKWQWASIYCRNITASKYTSGNWMEITRCMEASVYGKNRKKMNHTLKKTLAKLCQETQLKWGKVLPIAVLQVRVAPRSRLGLSSDEIICGRPFLSPKAKGKICNWPRKPGSSTMYSRLLKY